MLSSNININPLTLPAQIHTILIMLFVKSTGLATRGMGEGIGPAVESGLLAANALIQGSEYSLKSVTRSSLFNILLSHSGN
jgi:hypothetical protein